MHKSLCRISANNSISLLRIACVSTGSHGAKTASGWNGPKPIGNFLSTMCARDSSNLTGGSSWNSIGARTVLHFSHQNCARSLNRKVRRSFVGRPCLLRIQTNGHDLSRRESGELTRLACWRSRPRDRELFSPIQNEACSVDLRRKSKLQAMVSARAPKPARACAPQSYNFQSEQSQPSNCSTLEMSSANRL